MTRALDAEEISRQVAALPAWTLEDGLLVRAVEAPTFPVGVLLVDVVAEIAEEMDHHPDIDIRWRTVRFALTTHSVGGLSQLDIELAHRIDEAVGDLPSG